MRIAKRVPLTGDAPFSPIGLSDVVVGMQNLGWSVQSQTCFERRERPVWGWFVYVFGGRIVRLQMRHSERIQRAFETGYRLEAEIEQTGDGERLLILNGTASPRHRAKLDALCAALQGGERWLTPEGPSTSSSAPREATRPRAEAVLE